MAKLSLTISGILAIIVGLLVLVWPKLVRVLIGFYFIVFGILSLVDF